ncbi:MAG: OmpH family outer membrane protein [Caulobacteraceae bacterium]|nr:OmpH family outer membrane protein [Caulobacteraceae bacterium]
MHARSSVLIGMAAVLASTAPMSAFAQARAAAAPPAPTISSGPAIPGLCILSVNQAISSSTVGQYVNTRLGQIVAQVKAELSPEDTAINTEGRALQSQRTTLDANTLQTRAQALDARIAALRQKADLRQREVSETERKALDRIAQELQPIAQQLYQQHRCSALIDKGSVMIANPDMDLTGAAVTALNARIQQFPFDREHLDTAAAAPTARR